MDEPPAAIAELPAPPQPAAVAAPAPASKPQAEASPQWRAQGKNAKRDEVPAGILARVASRRGGGPACPPKQAAAGATRANPPAPPPPDACGKGSGHVESVEIDWHAPATTP
jgi:hypothetical protein